MSWGTLLTSWGASLLASLWFRAGHSDGADHGASGPGVLQRPLSRRLHLKVGCNGVPTPKRLGGVAVACRLTGRAVGVHGVRRYLFCPAVVGVFHSCSSLKRPVDFWCTVIHMIWHYVVRARSQASHIGRALRNAAMWPV